jgi:hypothetical protein
VLTSATCRRGQYVVMDYAMSYMHELTKKVGGVTCILI